MKYKSFKIWLVINNNNESVGLLQGEEEYCKRIARKKGYRIYVPHIHPQKWRGLKIEGGEMSFVQVTE